MNSERIIILVSIRMCFIRVVRFGMSKKEDFIQLTCSGSSSVLTKTNR